MKVRFRFLLLVLAIIAGWFLGGMALAQESPPVEQVPTDKSAPPPKDNRAQPPRSDNVPAGESSSKQTQTDVSPPANDASSHPEANLGNGDDEFTPYNPMKAMKDVEVGDFYYKKENYQAALSRYREALEFKPHDGEATFKLAEVLNKTGDIAGARENYEAYLKILPNGPYAKKAREALAKLPDSASVKNPATAHKAASPTTPPQSGATTLDGGLSPH
jgi:tetratricopeptide (TPR) repeat protein